jgi:hypothetical protein
MLMIASAMLAPSPGPDTRPRSTIRAGPEIRQDEQMAEHWPDATGDYATFMNTLPKVVFSRTLPAAGWAGSRIARGDLAEATSFPDGTVIHVNQPVRSLV